MAHFSPERDKLLIKDVLHAIRTEKMTERAMISERNAKITAFQKLMTEKYGADVLETCTLYHIVKGSSPRPSIDVDFDLPEGECERFIREEL